MPGDALFVVVSGAPGAGKSTLADALGRELSLPVLSKDTIKEALLREWGAEDIEASKRIGRASIAVLLSLAERSHGAVLESVWRRRLAINALAHLPGTVIEAFCACDPAVARERYAARSMERHGGHFDAQRINDPLWHGETAEPLAGGWPIVTVDTNAPVDAPSVAALIRAASLAPS